MNRWVGGLCPCAADRLLADHQLTARNASKAITRSPGALGVQLATSELLAVGAADGTEHIVLCLAFSLYLSLTVFLFLSVTLPLCFSVSLLVSLSLSVLPCVA